MCENKIILILAIILIINPILNAHELSPSAKSSKLGANPNQHLIFNAVDEDILTGNEMDDEDIDDQIYDDLDRSSSLFINLDEQLDLDEINPRDNKCILETFTSLNESKSSKVLKCGKIPVYCRQVCDSLKSIQFTEELKQIHHFAFRSYKIQSNYLMLNFSNSLSQIEPDSFNGLVIEKDRLLELNFGSFDYEDSISMKDDFDTKYDYDETDSDQIEYDMQMASTDPYSAKTESIKQDYSEKNTLKISKNAFKSLRIMQGAKLVINIRNYDSVVFEEDSLNFIEQFAKSNIVINIDSSSLVLFKSKCARKWTANHASNSDEYDYNEVKDNNLSVLPLSVLFRINISNAVQILFEKESFSNVQLNRESVLQILIDRFETLLIGKSSFAGLKQSELSSFEMRATNGKIIELSESVFANLEQSKISKFILNFNSSIGSDNLCLKKSLFSNLKQNFNSTLRLILQISESSSILFNSESLNSIKQAQHSLFQVYIFGANNILLDENCLTNLEQAQSSIFEIWSSKVGGEFKIQTHAFKSIRQASNSSIKLGFTNSKETSVFEQLNLAFDDFRSANDSQLIYDFSLSKNFLLNFPSRPMPRMILQPVSNNRDYSKRSQSIEEIALRLYPELGRQQRPDVLSFQNYQLKSSDFCKIAKIPFDVFVKLDQNTECTCSVFYLYRVLRHIKAENVDQKWLSNVPKCYKDKFLLSLMADQDQDSVEDLTAINDRDIKKSVLDTLEEQCKFREMIQNCNKNDLNAQFKEKDSLKCSTKDFEYFEEKKKEEFKSIGASEPMNKGNKIEDNYELNLNLNKVNIGSQNEFNFSDNSQEDNDSYDNDSSDDQVKEQEKVSFKMISYKKNENNSDSLFSFNSFKNSIKKLLDNATFITYFVIALISTVLILTVLFIIIILKLKIVNRKHGFVLYISDIDHDESDELHNHHHHHYGDKGGYYTDEESYNTINSKNQLIESVYKPRAAIYNLVEENANNDTELNNNNTNNNNKVIFLEYDRKDSINSSVILMPQDHDISTHPSFSLERESQLAASDFSYYHQNRNDNNSCNSLKIKENPLSKI
jgi:hypothetical protein